MHVAALQTLKPTVQFTISWWKEALHVATCGTYRGFGWICSGLIQNVFGHNAQCSITDYRQRGRNYPCWFSSFTDEAAKLVLISRWCQKIGQTKNTLVLWHSLLSFFFKCWLCVLPSVLFELSLPVLFSCCEIALKEEMLLSIFTYRTANNSYVWKGRMEEWK